MEKTKYNVDKDTEKRTYDGIVFDSVLEMKYYRDVLCPLMESGEVTAVEMQKPYELQPKFSRNGKSVRPITYVADFCIVRKDGTVSVVDTKGFSTPAAEMKKKMFWYHYPEIDYEWITYVQKYGGWVDYNYVKKQRSLRKLERKQKESEGDTTHAEQ